VPTAAVAAGDRPGAPPCATTFVSGHQANHTNLDSAEDAAARRAAGSFEGTDTREVPMLRPPPPGLRTEIKTPQPDPFFLPAQGACLIQLQGGQLPLLLLAREGKVIPLMLPLKEEDPEHQFAHLRQAKGLLRPTPTSMERALLLQHPLRRKRRRRPKK